MNSFTDKSLFTEDPQYILDNSDLLIKSDCKIFADVLYEKLDENEELPVERYRFFFNCDDYDYVVDEDMIKTLDVLYSY